MKRIYLTDREWDIYHRCPSVLVDGVRVWKYQPDQGDWHPWHGKPLPILYAVDPGTGEKVLFSSE
jgi:hypothetical protein